MRLLHSTIYFIQTMLFYKHGITEKELSNWDLDKPYVTLPIMTHGPNFVFDGVCRTTQEFFCLQITQLSLLLLWNAEHRKETAFGLFILVLNKSSVSDYEMYGKCILRPKNSKNWRDCINTSNLEWYNPILDLNRKYSYFFAKTMDFITLSVHSADSVTTEACRVICSKITTSNK